MLGSSSFESLILQATWPSDDPVPTALIKELVHNVVSSFPIPSQRNNNKKNMNKKNKHKHSSSTREVPALIGDGLLSKLTLSRTEIEDPFRILLHKMWTKACESDWRTELKSIFLLHILTRDTKESTSLQLSTTMISMSKYQNYKSQIADAKYFDVSMIGRVVVSEENAVHAPFIRAYAQHVVFIMRHFGGKFKVLRGLTATQSQTPTGTVGTSGTALVTSSSSEQEAVRVLLLAKKAIEGILRCKYTSADKRSVLVGQAMRLQAVDLRYSHSILPAEGMKCDPKLKYLFIVLYFFYLDVYANVCVNVCVNVYVRCYFAVKFGLCLQRKCNQFSVFIRNYLVPLLLVCLCLCLVPFTSHLPLLLKRIPEISRR